MKLLVIGLGSMGKRRVRCLKALGHEDITGFDMRDDRRKEAEDKYKINTIDDLNELDISLYDGFIISVPPDKHVEYIEIAIQNKIPAFVEASVVTDRLEEIDRLANQNDVLIAPSCTLRFHPAIKEIKNIVHSGKYGTFTNFSYHSGQYLPDWHPWEKVTDFYVSRKETGACREIVPFELTWLTDIIGLPNDYMAFYGRTMDVGAEIDDTYALILKFKQGFGTMLVDVVSRHAVRKLILNMEYGQIMWSWDEPKVSVYDARNRIWKDIKQKESAAYEGYNQNIIENMYVEELENFIKAINGEGKFPNTLTEDIEILRILYNMESGSK